MTGDVTLADPRPTNWRNLATILSVMVLVGTEVFGVALAAGWAIGGMFELGERISYVLMGLFSLAGVYVMVLLWRRSTRIEPVKRRG